jgi:energy-converting hydrogenase Eha subunit E
MTVTLKITGPTHVTPCGLVFNTDIPDGPVTFIFSNYKLSYSTLNMEAAGSFDTLALNLPDDTASDSRRQ